ncbi:MAG: alkaline phosphatase [Bacteroidales bacterium]|nr:alkaline phosphatase [Bacteroidales bacterium]
MNRSRMFRRLAVLSLLSVIVILPADARKKQQVQEPPTPKYVFYMIGDGMGINEVYGAQNYNQVTGDGPSVINFTQFPVRTFVTTFSASSLVTDSAASGTALATGVKTYNNGLGVDPDHNPVNSICVWAHEKGFGTGVATTVGVNHATPAAFYGHADNRNEYEKLATQLIESDFIDFAAGGGFLTERRSGHTGRYFEDKAREAGIAVLRGPELRNIASQKGRVICFNSDPTATEIKFGIDQRGHDTSLSDLVQAGIDYLYGKFGSKGFFFMVECGEIDGAGHNNDAKTNIMEVNDFAKTIDVVLAFCEQHPDECLILVTADHETGGLQLGENYIMHPELLTTQKWSEDEINRQFRVLAGIGPDRRPLPNRVVPTYDQVKTFLSQRLGLWSTIEVDEEQEAAFKEMYHKAFELNEEEIVESLYSVSNRIVSEAIVYANRKAGYLWAHGAHTGSPVGLYVYGARAAEFNNCTDNTQICKIIQRLAKY